MVGFDHKMSLSSEELKSMAREIRMVEKIKGTGKKQVSSTEWVTRKKYHVSAVSLSKINAGEILLEKNITYKNPGTGIPRKDTHLIVGKKAKETILEDTLLTYEMFEQWVKFLKFQ